MADTRDDRNFLIAAKNAQQTVEALRAQLVVAIEDAALLRAERDEALAKL